MSITFGDIIVWLTLGLLAGSLAGTIVTWTKMGYGRTGNLLVGLAGALIGGFIFKLFRINLGLGAIAVSAEDLVSALLGSVLLILVFRFINKKRQTRSSSSTN